MKFPEQFRWADAPHGYHSSEDDPFGWFIIPARHANGRTLACLATDGEDTGWQHVSVSIESKRCPSWEEMCIVKNLFWNDDQEVVQFHPPKSEYVNNHPGCLHLWRHITGHRLPPSILVGNKQLNEKETEALCHGIFRKLVNALR
jgi:hypothetical protein